MIPLSEPSNNWIERSTDTDNLRSQRPGMKHLHEGQRASCTRIDRLQRCECCLRRKNALIFRQAACEPHEWERKRLAGARLLPLASLFADLDLLDSLDAQAKILVYCEHGIRSVAASRYLREQGYDAYNLIVDWAQWAREQG